MRLQRADGEYRWFLVRTAPLRDEHGNVVKWYGVSIDIEDRKRVERQSLALIDAIPQQIWSGPRDGTLDYCNERWRSYMGIGTRYELIAARILQWKSAAAAPESLPVYRARKRNSGLESVLASPACRND
jgi:PAS domain-containing protein